MRRIIADKSLINDNVRKGIEEINKGGINMRVITEHTAIDVGPNVIEINYPGIIISAKEKNNELVIYAVEDPEEIKVERSVYVALTGEEPADPRFTFIDTVLVEGFHKISIAFHIFADNPIEE